MRLESGTGSSYMLMSLDLSRLRQIRITVSLFAMDQHVCFLISVIVVQFSEIFYPSVFPIQVLARSSSAASPDLDEPTLTVLDSISSLPPRFQRRYFQPRTVFMVTLMLMSSLFCLQHRYHLVLPRSFRRTPSFSARYC